MPRDNICLSVRAETLSGLRTKVDQAVRLDPDLIEARLDHLKDLNLDELGELLGSQMKKCVLTLRTSQGGEAYQGSRKKWRERMASLIDLGPRFVDLELYVANENRSLLQRARDRGVSVIVSWHDYEETPPQELLTKKLRESKDLGDVAKIVTMGSTFSDNIEVLKLYTYPNDGELVAFCMGETGMVSRVLATRLGAPFTYASLPGEPTGPGQPTIQELRRFFTLVPNVED
ncbi:MAG: type I 3-dehydroquinate dehydratase [Candidatus Geothermarchaeales archaeon]